MISKVTKFLYLLSVSFFLLFSAVYAQYEKKVDGVRIKQNITAISGDEYTGRETGTKGGEMTEEFFAKKFEELKLKPAGENNTYFYTYTIPFNKITGNLKLVIADRTFYYGRGEDFTLESNTSGGQISGEIAFAGYGLISPENKWNDFENLDIKDKVVLMRRGCPNNETEKWKEAASDSVKAQYCFKNGALGILFFEISISSMPYQMQISNLASYPRSLSRYNQIKNFPVFRIEDRVARYIFEGLNPDYNNILRNMNQKSLSCQTGKKVVMSANVDYDPNKRVRNVLAMIPGTDSKLKNEAIIIGGHIDHIGKERDGKINYGADDNASGSCVTLGVADAMIRHKFKPKRTIIFAGWSAEEKGLLGSAAWCKNPGWDLNKVVTYFNLDMVGLGDGNLNFPGIFYGPEVWNFIKENVDSAYLKKVNPSRGGPGGSDHTPFLQKGVPAFAGMTSGQHPDYHTPKDTPEKIDSDILQFVGDYMYKCIELIANTKKELIPERRNEKIKLQMANIISLAPLPINNYSNLLNNKDVDISVTSFSGGISGNDYDMNFLKILRIIDDSIKSIQKSKEFAYVQNMNETRMLAYQNKSGLMGCVNLSVLGYDELYCKLIAKTGIKFGLVKNDAPFAKDKFDKKKTLGNIMDAGMAIILDNLNTNEITNILNQVEKPVAIQSKDINILTDDIIKIIKSKGHLYIYQYSADIPTDKVISDLKDLKTKIGEGALCISMTELNSPNYEKFKELYISLDKADPGEGFTNKLFNENIVSFFTKAMQERQQQSRGRPF